MLKRAIGLLIAVTLMFVLIGGTCAPPGGYYRSGRGASVQDVPYPQEEVSALVRITSRPSHDCSPDVSPDGRLVAFESWEPDDGFGGEGNFDIWTVSAHGGGGYGRVTNSPTDDYYPSWYPDCSRLVFTSNRSSYPGIWAKAETGQGGTQKLSWTGTCDFSGDVGPNGDCVVFSRADGLFPTGDAICGHFFPMETRGFLPYQRIYRMDINGAHVTELGPGFDPQLSPDGSKIAYSNDKAGTNDIWIMDTDGRNKVQLTTYPGHEITPCWSPDGKWIAYAKSAPPATGGPNPVLDGDYWNIWTLRVSTGENFQKTFSRWFRDLSPSWGYIFEGNLYRDYIYFHSDRDDFENTGFDIYRIDPDMGIAGYDVPDISKAARKKTPERTYYAAKPRISVLNSTEKAGWAESIYNDLKASGYNVIGYGNTKNEKNLSSWKIYYKPGLKNIAKRLAFELPGDQFIHEARWDMGEADITVVLGGAGETKSDKTAEDISKSLEPVEQLRSDEIIEEAESIK